MVSHGSWSVFMVFHDSTLSFHGSRSVFMVFHGSRLVLHGSRWVFMVPGWYCIFYIENTLKLNSGPTIKSRPCRPWAGFGLVIKNLDFSQLFGDPKDLATPTMAKPTGARVEHTDFQNVPIFTAISGDELLQVRCGIWALESGYWRYAARVASHLLAHLSLIFLFQYY